MKGDVMTKCALVMTDIVGYSKKEARQQVESVKTLLSTWFLNEWPRSTKPKNRFVLPTGDGFIGVLPDLMSGSETIWLLDFVVSAIKRSFDAADRFQIRFGLHYGPCMPARITSDAIDFETEIEANNFFGYDVNYVARLTSCAGAGQIIASDQFIEFLEPTLSQEMINCYEVWKDAFQVAFKGDSVVYSSDGSIVVHPSMNHARAVGKDKRVVYSLTLRTDNESHGMALVPNNSVHYTGENSSHEHPAVLRTSFQRLPDSELFNLYRKEERIATITEPPFFTRLPFSVLYASGDEGPLNVLSQEEEDVNWGVDVSWLERTFGEIKKNKELCSLSGIEFAESPPKARLVYSKCEYKQSLASTISPDRCSNGDLNDSLRRRLWTPGRCLLPPLGGPNLTSGIGITAIEFTSDGWPIIQNRGSEGLHSNINSESASASGGVDWDDWRELNSELVVKLENGKTIRASHERLVELFSRNGKPGQLMPTDRAILREAAEEIALDPADIESVKLVGIAREFRRVGGPEFFYLIRSKRHMSAAAEQANYYAPYKWEYGGELKNATKVATLPDDLERQQFYFANLASDSRFNEITRLAFYFLWRESRATKL